MDEMQISAQAIVNLSLICGNADPTLHIMLFLGSITSQKKIHFHIVSKRRDRSFTML